MQSIVFETVTFPIFMVEVGQRLAASMGVGSDNLGNAVVHELNNDQISPEILPCHQFQGYAEYIEEQEACSACYGSLVHALERLREHGNLGQITSKLYIGQHFKKKCLDGIGIGSCTMDFARGCPPKARDIVAYLEGKEQ